MKKTIAIFFLAFYLLSTTQLAELLKMPFLVQHYIEHKQEKRDLSFIAFLKIHYAHGNTKDADYDKDMKLPFKTISNTVYAYSFFTPLLELKLNKLIYFKDDKQLFSDYTFTSSSSFLSSIWQPPKSC
ncbi:MAG: hypothetical protein ABI315_10390 [Bacteroidia bacterium]